MGDCPFCGIVNGDSALIRRVRQDIWIIVPLNPVVPGHVIAFPEQHVVDAAAMPTVTARAMEQISWWARDMGHEFNLITSAGPAATQTVHHLHIHYVPRREGDGLLLPWSNQHA